MCITSSFAQRNKWDVGFRTCLAYNSVYGGSSIESIYDPAFDFNIGLSGQYNTLRNIAIQVELNYERKGAKAVSDYFYLDSAGNITERGQYQINFNHDYLLTPILVRVQTPDRIDFYAEGGIYFGYLISANTRTKNYPQGEHTFSYTRQFQRFDFGVILGLGVQFPLTDRLFLSFDLRENFGLVDMYKRPASSGNQLKNNSVNVGCALVYRFGWREQK